MRRILPRGRNCLLAGVVFAACVSTGARAAPLVETEMFRKEVTAGKMPAVQKRVPDTPLVSVLTEPGMQVGKQGGTLNMLIGRARDVRLLVVYGYARLVGYDRKLAIVPDILESFESKDDKVFTFKIRKGHRWSDGHAFTTEDFRYFWEDVANNPELSPSGPQVTCSWMAKSLRSRSSMRLLCGIRGASQTASSFRGSPARHRYIFTALRTTSRNSTRNIHPR